MLKPADVVNRRILITDDNAAIHHDFRKVLAADAEQMAQAALATLEADIFGDTPSAAPRSSFDIDSAHQGEEGVTLARHAAGEGRPYAMAFVDRAGDLQRRKSLQKTRLPTTSNAAFR